jgi:hypothetical protein
LNEAWNTAINAQDKRGKIQALSLAKECYSMKLELLTNMTVVDVAVRFIKEKSTETAKIKEDGAFREGNIENAINQVF